MRADEEEAGDITFVNNIIIPPRTTVGINIGKKSNGKLIDQFTMPHYLKTEGIITKVIYDEGKEARVSIFNATTLSTN